MTKKSHLLQPNKNKIDYNTDPILNLKNKIVNYAIE